MKRLGLGVGVALALTLASLRTVAAPLDPSRADALVAAARNDGNDEFCKAPSRPLSYRTRALCPLVSEVKGCEALVAACNDDVAPKPQPERTPQTWDGFLHALGAIANVAVCLLIAAVVGAIVWFIVNAIQRGRRDDEAAEKPLPRRAEVSPEAVADVLETATEAELLLRQAAEHQRRGELRPRGGALSRRLASGARPARGDPARARTGRTVSTSGAARIPTRSRSFARSSERWTGFSSGARRRRLTAPRRLPPARGRSSRGSVEPRS